MTVRERRRLEHASRCCLRVVALMCASGLLAACGYRLAGSRLVIAEDVQTVAVRALDNRSRELGLGKMLAFAVEREIHRRGLLRLAAREEDADAVLTGTVRELDVWPVAFDAKDEALRYQAELSVDAELRRRDGRVVWRARDLRAVDEYSVAVRVVVASSSRFQQGTLDRADLQQLTDIQLAETERRITIERMLDAVARDLHDRLTDDF